MNRAGRARLTVTQLAQALSIGVGKYPRSTMAAQWALNSRITRDYWRRVARRAIDAADVSREPCECRK